MVEKAELIEKKSKRGGPRKGAGRKKGKLAAATIERNDIKKAIQDRIAAHADLLIRAQMTVGLGASYLYYVTPVRKTPKLITDPQTIEDYLVGKLEGKGFYYITTERPDSRAIDSMLDRAFGKADASLDVTTKGKQLPTPILGGLSVQPDDGNSENSET